MSSLASPSSSEPILTFEYDVLLIFFNDLDEDRPRTFLENRSREAGFKTLVADIVNDSTRKKIESCRIVMVLITPEFVRCQIERLKNILSQPKRVLPFFYGVKQNHVRVRSWRVLICEKFPIGNGKEGATLSVPCCLASDCQMILGNN
ncbi:hypothetical protein K1719_022983 [Acacia pycnantha]|nr:hypothetical protein K1719_022983 [Acacia pycnantha]